MSDAPKIFPPETFGVAVWIVLRAILASSAELRTAQLLDRVALWLERVQADERDNEYVAWLYRDARRLVEAALEAHTKVG